MQKKLTRLEQLGNTIQHPQVLPLTGRLHGFYRLRGGSYRVVFELLHERRVIAVHAIVQCSKAYRTT